MVKTAFDESKPKTKISKKVSRRFPMAPKVMKEMAESTKIRSAESREDWKDAIHRYMTAVNLPTSVSWRMLKLCAMYHRHRAFAERCVREYQSTVAQLFHEILDHEVDAEVYTKSVKKEVIRIGRRENDVFVKTKILYKLVPVDTHVRELLIDYLKWHPKKSVKTIARVIMNLQSYRNSSHQMMLERKKEYEETIAVMLEDNPIMFEWSIPLYFTAENIRRFPERRLWSLKN